MKKIFKNCTIHFAPLEGFTDDPFRITVSNEFVGWDTLFTDFLRVPTVGNYPDRVIVEHFGQKSFNDPKIKEKTVLQILTTPSAQTEFTIKQIEGLGFKWIDLNLGCPSRTV